MAQALLHFRAEDELVEVIDSLADDNSVDRSEAIRMLVREGLRSITVQIQQLADADPRQTKRHRPSPLDDAILAVREAMKGNQSVVERILVTGRSVQSGLLLAYLSAALLQFANEDPETVLDKWGEQTRARMETKKQIRVIRKRAKEIARG